jgi:hypothetical protein
MSHGIEELSLSGKRKILLGKGTEAIYKSPPEHGQGIVITPAWLHAVFSGENEKQSLILKKSSERTMKIMKFRSSGGILPPRSLQWH